MRTYVRMIHNSEGASPKDVIPVMQQLGFEPALGVHDFVYKWKKKVTLNEVLELLGKMHKSLSGLNVNYEVTTVE